MGLVEAVERLGERLNPQLEAQVVGGGLARSLRGYSAAFTAILALAPAAAGATVGLLLYMRGYPPQVYAVAGVGAALVAFVLLLALYISLPSLAARSRADRLERKFLLLATMLAALVYSGEGLGEAFLRLGRGVPEELRDFKLELEYIASLLSVGRPIHEVLEAAARLTPSPSLRSLLLGLSAASKTGTGVAEVIEASITEYLSVRETEIDRVTNSLGALLELYTAVAVMLPIGMGVVGLLLLFQPVAGLSFDLILAVTTFILVPVTVIAVVLVAESLVSKLKG